MSFESRPAIGSEFQLAKKTYAIDQILAQPDITVQRPVNRFVYRATDVGNGSDSIIVQYIASPPSGLYDTFQEAFDIRCSLTSLDADQLTRYLSLKKAGESPKQASFHSLSWQKKQLQRSQDSSFVALTTYRPGITLDTFNLGDDYSTERTTLLIAIAQQVLQILDMLMRNRVVHGDIKPGNLVIDNSKTVGIIDPHTLCEVNNETRVHPFVSPFTAAPETLSGRVVITTDLYSLGCTILSQLEPDTRKSFGNPFAQNVSREEMLQQHFQGKFFPPDIQKMLSCTVKSYPEPVREEVESFFTLLSKLIQHQPKNRPQSAQEALAILQSRDFAKSA